MNDRDLYEKGISGLPKLGLSYDEFLRFSKLFIVTDSIVDHIDLDVLKGVDKQKSTDILNTMVHGVSNYVKRLAELAKKDIERKRIH